MSLRTSPLYRADVWLLQTPPHSLAPVTPYLDLLSKAEQEAAQRILITSEKNLFIRSKAFLRMLLCARTHVAPDQWRFGCNAFGRPFVESPLAYSHLHFNVSHTKGLTACVISELVEIGIDVENVAQERDFLAMARGFFAHSESERLAATPEADLSRNFYAYWTLKEAYVKAKGMGLSIPLSSMSFDLSDASGIAFHAEAEAHPDGWRFLSTPVADEAMLALAIGIDADTEVEIAMHRVAPEFLGGLNVESSYTCALRLIRSRSCVSTRPGPTSMNSVSPRSSK
ncbi:4'-phosphopantetheinyl transferase [Burkholderia sp. lig30]|jgi:4'-phosphopantetheinyl transferase|uniref:4'-phosphopantetheinyl transferase family protein n=1 Tax=Burkholderia sp. lig30 TaxID=1192124 RepID=UPI0004611087|nr:4'-phosphopantetheinyl transferase superfamily protein [Burkholderia sp. lig30]KDB06340.1 4'-phosphopantetheinyl transferase [Burkholderia sp. lig30]